VLTVTAPGGPSASQSWTVGAVCVPVFNSSAPLAAEQDNTYTYNLDATAPHGVPVTFQLTAAPTGATLSGDVLTWTPTAKQSRTANQFEVTATAGGGSKATQSWTVTPNGTISGSCIDNYWTEQGSGPLAADLSGYTVSAGIPQASGATQNLTGTVNAANGTFTILNVPAGYYVLVMQAPDGYIVNYLTNSSNFDCGTDYAGPVPPSSISGTLGLDLTALDTWAAGDGLALVSADSGVYCDLTGSTAVVNDGYSSCSFNSSPANTTFSPADPAAFSGFPIVSSASNFILQYDAVTDGVVLGSTLLLPSSLTLASGDSPTISGSLALPSTTNSIDITVDGSAWGEAYAEQAPTSATRDTFLVDLAVQPIVGDRVVAGGATQDLTTLNIPQIENLTLLGVPPGETAIQGISPPVPPAAPLPGLQGAALGLVSLNVTQTKATGDLGKQTFNNPFPSGWPVVFSARGGLCDSSGSNLCAEIGYSTTTLPTAAIAPPMSPVSNAQLNGTSLITATKTTTPAVTLTWDAPTGMTPYGYAVFVYQATSPYSPVIAAYTTQTSAGFTLNVSSVFFVIEALADGGQASILTGPYRWKYPTAYAAVMSGPVTIGGL
jgi:hypothetical protein